MNQLVPSIFAGSSGAEFSKDRKHRYALWRIWNRNKPLIMFIGLNPSTANESKSDPTINRVIRFASDWGYGGVVMVNLFGIVSADPKTLKTAPDPLGDNDRWLDKASLECKDVIFAWGNFKEAKQRGEEMISRFPEAYALQVNKNWSPKHPLYVRASTVPVLFRRPNISMNLSQNKN